VDSFQQQIHTVARELHAQNIILTYQHVGAVLGTPRCFREQVAREALHQAQRELNWMYGESSIQQPGASEDGEKCPAQNVL
jgi:alkylated DNA nucleotide flippase Atl1